jgi:hypothetical protein
VLKYGVPPWSTKRISELENKDGPKISLIEYSGDEG